MIEQQIESVEQVNMIVATWDAIPFIFQTMIVCFVAVVAVIEGIKYGWLTNIKPKAKKSAMIWRISMYVGVIVGLAGAAMDYFNWIHEEVAPWFWLFVCATAGTASNIIHHFITKVIWGKFSGNSKKQRIQIISREQIMKMPKEPGKEDAPTQFGVINFVDDDD